MRRPFLKELGYEVMLGSGAYGQVHKVDIRANPCRKYAVKVLDFGRPRSRLTQRLAREELAIVEKLIDHKHPYLVRLFRVYRDNDHARMYSKSLQDTAWRNADSFRSLLQCIQWNSSHRAIYITPS